MKVYFGTSRRIKQLYREEVEAIYSLIEKWGYSHTSDYAIKVAAKKPQDFAQLHKEAIEGIRKADICIFEVSRHSLSVGYLINYSINLSKPVVVLSQNKSVAEIFKAIDLPRLSFFYYKDIAELKRGLRRVIKKAASQVDIRFNFFITPSLLSYLSWVAERKRIPRSVYLRNLIEEDMRKNKEYQEKVVVLKEK